MRCRTSPYSLVGDLYNVCRLPFYCAPDCRRRQRLVGPQGAPLRRLALSAVATSRSRVRGLAYIRYRLPRSRLEVCARRAAAPPHPLHPAAGTEDSRAPSSAVCSPSPRSPAPEPDPLGLYGSVRLGNVLLSERANVAARTAPGRRNRTPSCSTNAPWLKRSSAA